MKYTTAIALLLNSTQAATNTGTAGCDCLATPTPHAFLIADSEPAMATAITGSDVFNSYPVGFGFDSCRAHEEGTGPSCNNTDETKNPDWCKTDWCYVAKTCTLTNHASSYFSPDRCDNEPVYYYSYVACGETDTFTPTGYNKVRYDLECTKYSAMTEEQKTEINAANVEYVAGWVTDQKTTTACTGACDAETDTCAQILVNDAAPLLRCVPTATCSDQTKALQALVGGDSSSVAVNCGEDNWKELSGVKLVASMTAALVAATMI